EFWANFRAVRRIAGRLSAEDGPSDPVYVKKTTASRAACLAGDYLGIKGHRIACGRDKKVHRNALDPMRCIISCRARPAERELAFVQRLVSEGCPNIQVLGRLLCSINRGETGRKLVLDAVLRKGDAQDGHLGLTLLQQIKVFEDALEALSWMHLHGYVHGDFKRSQVLLDCDGSGHEWRGFLADFGWSGKVTDYSLGGSPFALAPELLPSRSNQTLWMLGAQVSDWRRPSLPITHHPSQDMWAVGYYLLELALGYEVEPEPELSLRDQSGIDQALGDFKGEICGRNEDLRRQLLDLSALCFKVRPKDRISAKSLLIALRKLRRSQRGGPDVSRLRDRREVFDHFATLNRTLRSQRDAGIESPATMASYQSFCSNPIVQQVFSVDEDDAHWLEMCSSIAKILSEPSTSPRAFLEFMQRKRYIDRLT
ncbi:MAG: hypothetical protein KDK78_04345, partial [Chlamydiia bacterium]|nr:hypothetical protein [Chlamydiia bacterium]